jgi:RNA polymerase sigma-70 factor (ECF subfamily)
MDRSDDELVSLVLSGDNSAFTELYNRHVDRVTWIIRHIINNNNELDDVVQNAFMSAFRSLHTYRGNGKFKGWMSKTATNRGIAFIIASKRYIRKQIVYDTDVEDMYDRDDVLSTYGPDTEIELEELQADINSAIDSMTVDQRTAITMHAMHGVGHDVIAEIIGGVKNTIQQRITRARKIIRRKLNG